MSNIKSTFFTSDFHIGHENVLKYDERPFDNLDHMHETLITRYNAMVSFGMDMIEMLCLKLKMKDSFICMDIFIQDQDKIKVKRY